MASGTCIAEKSIKAITKCLCSGVIPLHNKYNEIDQDVIKVKALASKLKHIYYLHIKLNNFI